MVTLISRSWIYWVSHDKNDEHAAVQGLARTEDRTGAASINIVILNHERLVIH